MKTINNPTAIIATLLNCGFADAEFIMNELEAYKVDFDDVYNTCVERELSITADNIIPAIYEEVACRFGIDYERLAIHANCLASTFYIDDKIMADEDSVKEIAA